MLERLKREDKMKREAILSDLREYLSKYENGDEVYAAILELQSIYDESVIDWIAGLYEPRVCPCYGLYGKGRCENTKHCGTSAFYYSNSGRDSFGYLPDVETTIQILTLLSHMGIDGFSLFDEEVKERIGKFVLSLQEENGYFYHPQWESSLIDEKFLSRRSRDLNWSTKLLKGLGLTPKFDTPNGMKGVNKSLATKEKGEEKRDEPTVRERSIPEMLVDKDSFEKFLSSLYYNPEKGEYGLLNRSYHIGNTLAAMTAEIIERDRVLAEEGADYRLGDILLEWLNAGLIEGAGHWNGTVDKSTGKTIPESNYYAVNGIMKISGIYSKLKKPYPNADLAAKAAVDAILSPTRIGQIVDIYNTWVAIDTLRDNLLEFSSDKSAVNALDERVMSIAPEAIAATAEKISLFKKADGSFSYNPVGGTGGTSQGCKVSIPYTNEGDVNATNIAFSTMNWMFAVLGVPRPPLFGEAEMYKLKEKMRSALPIIKGKNNCLNIGKPFDFEASPLGDYGYSYPYLVPDCIGCGKIEVVSDIREGRAGKILKLSSPKGSSESLKSYAMSYNDYMVSTQTLKAEMMIKGEDGATLDGLVESLYHFILKVEGEEIVLYEDDHFGTTRRLCKVGNVGEWFTLTVDMTLAEEPTFTAKVYSDYSGENRLVGESNLFRVYDEKNPKVLIPKHAYIKLSVRECADLTLHLANFHNYRSNK